MKYVLFVCTHNAGRSQMAQAFFERHAPEGLRAESAGQDPAAAVWPEVVDAMNEVGIDLSQRRPKKLDLEMQLHADWAITLACGGTCHNARLARLLPGLVEEFEGLRAPEEIRACADAVLGRYGEAPVRSFVLTLADRDTRECLRAERCVALTG